MERMSENQEEKLRAMEEENYCLREIIENVSEGVILTDRNCRIPLFNLAKAQMEQMDAEEALGEISWEALRST